MSKKWKRIVRPATAEERARHAEIREKVVHEFPPLESTRPQPATDGIGARVRAAREERGLTRYVLAEKAGVQSSRTVRDIEHGRDAKLSDLRAVVEALGLELALVEPASEAT